VNPIGSSAEAIRFGVFEADPRTGELRKHGQRINLQEQPFRVLCLLLERPGDLVTREELRLKLWGADHFVDFEHGLNKAISKLREALGDDCETPRYIETLPRRGYRFIAPTVAAETPSESDQSEVGPTTRVTEIRGGFHRRSRWMAAAAILLAGVLVPLASSVWHKVANSRGVYPIAGAAFARPIRSLAVLPLQSLSTDPGQEFFAEGMTDELITDLGQMSALRVISRTSVMHYRQTTKTLPQIGRELGADAVVEGTVFSSGGRVRITAQLIDTRTDRHLWAQEYERDLRDVLDLQDDVARDIADEIRLTLTPQERARLAGSHPVDPQAHEAYLKGRYYWNEFTQPGVRKSLGFFQQAIEQDPNYALGYSGLADYYGVMYVRFAALPRNEACPKGEAAALKAIALDESLAEAHHSLAAVRLFCDWDMRGAENEFKRAIQLNPNYAEARRVYAFLLAVSGRGDGSITEMKWAVEDDPMSADLNQALGWIFYVTRHYDQAIAQYQIELSLDHGRAGAHGGLGDVYVQQGRFDLALREYRKAMGLSGRAPWALSDLGYADALAGQRGAALEVLAQLNQMSLHRSVPAVDEALVYLGLGDKQHALTWLDRAYEQHDSGLLGLKVDPQYDSLRSEPRLQELIRRVGL
jgi:TolB-like protein/DNA-binding winged helix-turn-helix (wHTH) protein/Tfp pilus assembly protein PilF